MEMCDAHLMAIWSLTDSDWNVEGFENWLAAVIARGMPGSGCLRHQTSWHPLAKGTVGADEHRLRETR